MRTTSLQKWKSKGKVFTSPFFWSINIFPSVDFDEEELSQDFDVIVQDDAFDKKTGDNLVELVIPDPELNN